MTKRDWKILGVIAVVIALSLTTAPAFRGMGLKVAFAATKAAPMKAAPGSQMNKRLEALYQEAKKEGTVVIWGPTDAQVNWIPKEFAKDFPGIEVQWSAQSPTEMPTKMIAQQRAGHLTVDVGVGSMRDFLPLYERGILGMYDWNGVFAVPGDRIYLDGAAVRRYSNIFAHLYNPDKVKKEDLPKTWEDFLDPKWQGKIQGDAFLFPAGLAFVGLEWGEKKTTDFATALRDKSKIMINQSTEQMLASGERPIIMFGLQHWTKDWRSKGESVEWFELPSTGATRHMSVFLKDAPHPSAARLLTGWLAGDKAEQLSWRYTGFGDPTPGSGTEVSKIMAATGTKLIFESRENMERRAKLVNMLRKMMVGK